MRLSARGWNPSERPTGQGELTSTQRSYRREAERLLLWAVLERGKALSSLSGEDATDYRAFLAHPPVDWCGPRHHQRRSPIWRPSLTCEDFQQVDYRTDDDKPATDRLLSVIGKGGRIREVPVPWELVNELGAEPARHGFDPQVDAASNRGIHVMARFDSKHQRPTAWPASGLYQGDQKGACRQRPQR